MKDSDNFKKGRDKRTGRFGSFSQQENHFEDQARKSVGRMPWHQEPKKDVISCEKPRGGANNLRSADIRMGKPGREKVCHYNMNP